MASPISHLGSWVKSQMCLGQFTPELTVKCVISPLERMKAFFGESLDLPEHVRKQHVWAMLGRPVAFESPAVLWETLWFNSF